MKITYKEKDHSYELNGVPVPSVTGIIRGSIGEETYLKFISQFYLLRGTAVHLACELLDLNDLDYDTVDPIIKPFVSAYERFLEEHHPTWTEIEGKLGHKIYRYCGRLDRAGEVDTFETVLDIKTNSCPPYTKNQLAGYVAARENLTVSDFKYSKTKRMSLVLHQNGTYELKRYDDPYDFAEFIAMLTINNMKNKWR